MIDHKWLIANANRIRGNMQILQQKAGKLPPPVIVSYAKSTEAALDEIYQTVERYVEGLKN